ncbi:hypothetical protein AVEN_131150-1 [Araneus ventricosus]|uniref:Uncharacterized protein n=1 Tax=Araneus ventricosus TaxID=182803 RepID=A0A4Y2RXD0_ARAVE|nr:hypothetical protein AVEN_131150-1 [Araneus ventricosus]
MTPFDRNGNTLIIRHPYPVVTSLNTDPFVQKSYTSLSDHPYTAVTTLNDLFCFQSEKFSNRPSVHGSYLSERPVFSEREHFSNTLSLHSSHLSERPLLFGNVTLLQVVIPTQQSPL